MFNYRELSDFRCYRPSEVLSLASLKNQLCLKGNRTIVVLLLLVSTWGLYLIFTQPATPIKCAGAPQKILYLAEDHFRTVCMH